MYVYMYIYIYSICLLHIWICLVILRDICLCVCLAMLLGFSKWSKPNVSTRMFVKSGMFVLFWKLSKPSNATWHHRWICLGLLWKNHTEKKIRKDITETQHSVLIGSWQDPCNGFLQSLYIWVILYNKEPYFWSLLFWGALDDQWGKEIPLPWSRRK